MESERAFDLDSSWLEETGDAPPVALPPPPWPAGRPDPADDAPWATLVTLAIIVGLGALKLALFTVGTAGASLGVGVVFVLAHVGAFLAGASWFWERRYHRD